MYQRTTLKPGKQELPGEDGINETNGLQRESGQRVFQGTNGIDGKNGINGIKGHQGSSRKDGTNNTNTILISKCDKRDTDDIGKQGPIGAIGVQGLPVNDRSQRPARVPCPIIIIQIQNTKNDVYTILDDDYIVFKCTCNQIGYLVEKICTALGITDEKLKKFYIHFQWLVRELLITTNCVVFIIMQLN